MESARRARSREIYAKRQRSKQRLAAPEPLEAKLPLATNVYNFDSRDADLNVEYGWVVFVQDAAGDDLYLRETYAPGSFGIQESWQYSDSADFSSSQYLPSTFNFQDVIVTSGRIQSDVQAFNGGPSNFVSSVPFYDFPGPSNLAADPEMTPFAENEKDVIPGTASGLLTIYSTSLAGTAFFPQLVAFHPQYLYDHYDGEAGDDLEGGVVPLMLQVGADPAATSAELTILVPNEDGDELEELDITISNAELDYSTGRVQFEVFDGEDPFPVFFGARMWYATSFVPTRAGNFQLAAGLDFESGLHVYNRGPDSTVAINSPMVPGTSPANYEGTHLWIDGFNAGRTTELQDGLAVSVSAPITVGNDVRLNAERVVLSSRVEAQGGISLEVADSDETSAVNRGSLLLSNTGSLTGFDGAATRVVRIAAYDSDIDIFGLVSANFQSYQFHTVTSEVAGRFTTRNAVGQRAGMLAGNTVDVLLTNETQINLDDNLLHVVSLDTSIDSLRMTAAEDTTLLAAPYQPYRYDVSIREEDDLSLDATMASGDTVRISVGGDLSTTANIQSQRDVTLTAAGAISGRAWVTTVDGQIAVTGEDVLLEGLLQVLAPPVDETIVDIAVAATNGGIDLQGGARAVNVVRFEQSGTGALSATDIVAAEYLQAFADGSVTLQTDSRFIDVESGGTVTIIEADDAEFRLAAGGLTSISVAGVDQTEDGNARAALKAELRGTNNVTLTAPSGSIDVTALTSSTLTIGDTAKLLDGTATSMEAAGSVSIRSTQGDVVVLDAPTAGDGMLRARAVSAASSLAGNLLGDYSQNMPGLRAATLTAQANGNLNNAIGFEAIFPGFNATSNPLRTRDIVLLRGQSNAKENGLYQVTNVGNATTQWQLTRVSRADTTAELVKNTRIAITDGEFRNLTFIVGDYANELNSTPLQVVEGDFRSKDEMVVDYATDEPLDGTFATGVITGNSADLVVNGDISNDGIIVQDNQVVLVRLGTMQEVGGQATSRSSNGVYRKTTVGGVWQLQRLDIDPNVGVLPAAEGSVVVLGGYYRTAVTGKTFTIMFNGLGLVDLPIDIEAVDANGDGKFTPSESTILSKIGSFDPRDATTFVVSTSGGTNDAAGSLGKILTLLQRNSATDLTDEPVEQVVRFGNILGGSGGVGGDITLRQELPVIEKSFQIDAASRYPLSSDATLPIVLDGSRITSSRENTFVTRATTVNGIEFTEGASTSLLPTAEEAIQSRLSGLRLVGFESGGAIVVDGASNVVIENLIIGTNSQDQSQAVKYGIHITGNSGVSGPVTLLNNQIYSASVFSSGVVPLEGAGVQIDGAAQHVQVVGGTIGRAPGSNTSGIVVASSNDNSTRANSIGVNPLPLVELATVSNRATLSIPQAIWDVIGEELHLGQAVSGDGIATNSEIIHIDPLARQVTLSARMSATLSTSEITFGAPARTTVADNFFGVQLLGGNVRMVNTTVRDNVVDGIVVGTALPDAIWARIGAGIVFDDNGEPDPTLRSSASNAIYGNGRYGIRFASGIEKMTVSLAPANPPTLLMTTEIKIRGNFIGTDTSGANGLQNGRRDYYWDLSRSSEVPPDGSAGTGLEFDSLITSGDPLGDTPAEDNGNGNISADLGPTEGTGSGGGSGGSSGGSSGGVQPNEPLPTLR